MGSANSVATVIADVHDDRFPLRWRTKLRDKFGLALRFLGDRPAFSGLLQGPWAVLLAVMSHFELHGEAHPGQERIATEARCSSRAVRDALRVLEAGGFLSIQRVRYSDGTRRLYYSPGDVLLSELAAFEARYPDNRPKTIGRKLGSAPPPPPEESAGGPPEESAGKLLSLQTKRTSFCDSPSRPAPELGPILAMVPLVTRQEEEQFGISPVEREIAEGALAELRRRRHPSSAAPRWFDSVAIELVARCAREWGGDVAGARLAMQDAISGAWLASKDRPPTVKFIWGTVDHFLDHAHRGQTRRRAIERAERLVTPTAKREPKVTIATPDQIAAELARLFGAPEAT